MSGFSRFETFRIKGIGRAYHSEQLLFSDFAELTSYRVESAKPEFRIRTRYLDNERSQRKKDNAIRSGMPQLDLTREREAIQALFDQSPPQKPKIEDLDRF